MSTATVELVLFEIGGVRYATDLSQVRRIGALGDEMPSSFPLGRPRLGKRALVFAPDESHEAHLAIDAVLGVHTVPVDDLRRLPLAVASSKLAVGAWVVDGGQTVLLIDLQAATAPSGASVKGIA